MSLRIIFMGTPEFSVPVLAAIIAGGQEVVACYTRAPKPGGRRGLELTKSPVHAAAEKLGIPVFTPRSLRNDEEAELFRSHSSDVAVVVAYGLILPKAILDAPRLGCLNLHASLLPRWRGAAPIQRAIMAGDLETGVMVMRMDEGLDTGPVAMVERVAIGPDMTTGHLHDALMHVGADLMARALAALSRGALDFRPQADDGVTYASKIEKAEARIDWNASASQIHNRIRGLSPFPGAWFELDFGKGAERIKILRSQLAGASGAPGEIVAAQDELIIACGEGAVKLLDVQRAGKTAVGIDDFLRGANLVPGVKAQ